LAAVALTEAPDESDSVGSKALWGFVDSSGKTRIPFRFAEVKSFQEGLAAARESTAEKWGFIDMGGAWHVKPQYDRVVASFADGLSIVEKDRRQMFIDRSGKEAFSLKLRRAKPFSEGLAACSVFTPLGLRVGFINRDGDFVIPPRYLVSGSFSEGLCAVRLPAGYGYIDHSGGIATAVRRVFSAGPFRGGVATLMISTERRGFLFRDGTVLVEDGDDRSIEADTLEDDAVGLSEEELLARLAEAHWGAVSMEEVALSQMLTIDVQRLPPSPRHAVFKRVLGWRNGVRGTWWLTRDMESGKYRVFHNRFVPSHFME
jgi:hypothetical protein